MTHLIAMAVITSSKPLDCHFGAFEAPDGDYYSRIGQHQSITVYGGRADRQRGVAQLITTHCAPDAGLL